MNTKKTSIPKRLRDGVWGVIETGVQEWIASAYIGSDEYKSRVESGVENRVKKLRSEAKEAKLKDVKWMNEQAAQIDLDIRMEKVAEFKRKAAPLQNKAPHMPKDFLITEIKK